MEKLQKKLGRSERSVYRLIQKRSSDLYLSREQAALAVALEYGINVSSYATDDDMAAIRHAAATQGVGPAPAPPPIPSSTSGSGRKAPTRKKSSSRKSRGGKKVFVVHGRDEKIRKAMFGFLRALGLTPLEWQHALKATGTASPYVGEVLDKAFKDAAAVVVLLTPDDVARLKEEFLKKTDKDHERNLTGQPRPNVLFEAGMAFGHQPKGTVLVQVGEMREISDVLGRHVVHLSNSTQTRAELANKLETAGCTVDRTGTDWMTEGDFD